jgi:Ca2+-binding EF-hand superfamily protein
MMELVDTKRKGFLDLNDIFELAGKVTENELFDIFKFLDARKTGEIRIEDLQLALGDSQLTSNNKSKEHIFPRFYTIIDTVKDKPKSTAQLKKKFGLTPPSLKSFYQYICDLTQSKYLSLDDLLAVLKSQFIRNEIKWSKTCESVVK